MAATSSPARAFRALTFVMLVSFLAPIAAAHSGGDEVVHWTFPSWVLWFSGAMVVAISFAVVGAFLSRQDASAGIAPEDAREVRASAFGSSVAFALLMLVAAHAFFPSVSSGFPEAIVWILAWAALPMIAYAGSGDVWARVNPFAPLGRFAEAVRGGFPRAYPSRLGAWPAVVFLIAFVGFEVADARFARDAAVIGRVVLAYTVFTFAGMYTFGARVWLANGEAFTRAFAWWSAFSPFRGSSRLPGGKLVAARVSSVSEAAFAVALLFGVNYDSFLATESGARAFAAVANAAGGIVAHFVLLTAGFLVFFLAFLACATAIQRFAFAVESRRALVARFAASLIPIAVAYHFAHNLPYVLQNLPALAAGFLDPFGLGLAPFSEATVAVPVLLAPYLGTLQVLVILTGHVYAVIIAHHLAFAGFPSRVQAIRSEVPLTAIMVFYTFIGLWLLSSGVPSPGVGA